MGKRKLTGSRAIITGVSSGIGREIARQLAARDVQMVVTARRQDRLDQLVAELSKRQHRVIAVPGDITDAQLRRQLVETARSELGGLDILINNAGVGAIGPFATAAPDRLRRIMEVNFFAPVELIRASLELLAGGKQPMIVNVSSVLGHRAIPLKSEYCASKFALHGFSDALRAELATQRIDVLLVSPSTTRSEFFDNVLEKQADLKWLKWGAMPAARVAAKTVRAMERGRHEIILTPGGKMLVWLDRLCPPLVNRLIARFG